MLKYQVKAKPVWKDYLLCDSKYVCFEKDGKNH